MSSAQILLAEDHELRREGLIGLINAQPDLEVVGQAGDGREALIMARDLDPDLIVMDIDMPVLDGLKATRLIRELLPETRIVLLTSEDNDEKLFQAIKSGVNGFILKDTSSADFLSGVRRVLRGGAVLPPKLAALLLDEFSRLANQPHLVANIEIESDLTHREREVLDLLATGATNREIALQLTISLHTVKSHVRSILSKLQVVNRRQAARLAARLGLLSENIETSSDGGSPNMEKP